MGQMDSSGTEDLGIIARLMYGYVLSNEAVLGPKETSFVLISGLIPQDVSRWILIPAVIMILDESRGSTRDKNDAKIFPLG